MQNVNQTITGSGDRTWAQVLHPTLAWNLGKWSVLVSLLTNVGNSMDGCPSVLTELLWCRSTQKLYLKSKWDFPGGPLVKTSLSNAGDVGSIPGWGIKIPRASWPKHQNIKQKQYWNKFNEDLKNLVGCSPWGRQESDTTERLNWTELKWEVYGPSVLCISLHMYKKYKIHLCLFS